MADYDNDMAASTSFPTQGISVAKSPYQKATLRLNEQFDRLEQCLDRLFSSIDRAIASTLPSALYSNPGSDIHWRISASARPAFWVPVRRCEISCSALLSAACSKPTCPARSGSRGLELGSAMSGRAATEIQRQPTQILYIVAFQIGLHGAIGQGQLA